LPIYEDFGFAVFKLRAGLKRIHSMALEFPRRDPKSLFFPTVHVHDGHSVPPGEGKGVITGGGKRGHH